MVGGFGWGNVGRLLAPRRRNGARSGYFLSHAKAQRHKEVVLGREAAFSFGGTA